MNDHSTGLARRRRQAIRELIGESPVRSQKDLARLLRARGLAATQPTLSRDIRELGLVKGADGYAAPEAAPTGQAPGPAAASLVQRRRATVERLVFDFVLSADAAGRDPSNDHSSGMIIIHHSGPVKRNRHCGATAPIRECVGGPGSSGAGAGVSLRPAPREAGGGAPRDASGSFARPPFSDRSAVDRSRFDEEGRSA